MGTPSKNPAKPMQLRASGFVVRKARTRAGMVEAVGVLCSNGEWVEIAFPLQLADCLAQQLAERRRGRIFSREFKQGGGR